jgi:3-methylcrotonyl-CoA carboxylase alpha subunit
VRLSNGDIAVMEQGETFTVRPYDPFVAADSASAASDRVTTPMPGKIIQLLVKPGDAVKKGQPLAVLEAMKMEHTLAAPADAKVASVDVAQGDQVNDGAIVVRFETEKAA